MTYWIYILYLVVTISGATLVAGLAAYAWMHRSTAGAGALGVLLSSVSLWALLVVLELLSPDGRSILILVKFEYILIAVIPPTVLVFALRYTGRREWLPPPILIGLALVPLATIVFMWTNDSHRLIWLEYEFVRDGAFLLQVIKYGLWFWINYAYAYLVMVVAAVILAVQATSLTKIYRRQALAVVIGVCLPALANVVYVFRISPVEHLDLTPLGFMAGGIVMALAVFRYRLLDLAPVARDKLVDNARDVMFVVDGAGRISDVNRAALDLLNVSESEVLGRNASDVLDFWRELESSVANVDRTGMSVSASLSVPHGTRHYDVRISPLRPTAQGSAGFLLVLRDVSAYRRAQELQRALYQISEAASSAQDLQALYPQVHRIIGELIPAENFFIALSDNKTDAISCPYHVDAFDPVPRAGSLREWGDTLTGFVISTGEPLLVSTEADRSVVRSLGVKSRGTPSSCWLGVPLRTADSKTIGAVVVQSYREQDRYREEDKAVLSFVSTQIAMAIERKRAQQALRTSEEHFRRIFHGAGMAIAILAPDDGRLVETNPAWNAWLGYSPGELCRMTWSDVVHPDDVDQVGSLLTSVAATGNQISNNECRWLRKDGQTARGLVTVSLLGAEDRGSRSTICMVQDITSLRNAEEERQALLAQYLQSQKMETIGRLTAGIAHDFNNLLTVINGYAERVRAALPTEHPLREPADRIAQSGWRAAELVHQLLIFSRKSMTSRRALDVNVAVNETGKMLRRVIGEDIDLAIMLGLGVWSTDIDSTQFEQILFNLAVNARDAMPGGGKLVISTQNSVVSEVRAAEMDLKIVPGDYVVLSVQDTGTGMREEVRRRIFEPFFTTKEEGKGTGLGLATVWEIVTQNAGGVQVESTEGSGSVFRVYLPRGGDLSQKDGDGGRFQSAGRRERGGTILVVEDDENMRAVIRQTLEDGGYTVVAVANGEEALVAEESHPAAIDVLLADVVLPGKNGRGVAEDIVDRRPLVRVILMSGYSDEVVQQYGTIPTGVVFLQKPFGPQELVDCVREVLDVRD